MQPLGENHSFPIRNLICVEVLSDNHLMKKVQEGDLSKLGLLYERHSKDVFAYFYRCTGDREKSEDMVQNLFIRILKYKDTFKGTGQFSYWLFATARNLWYDDHRKKDPLRKKDDLSDVMNQPRFQILPDDALELSEKKVLLQQAMDRLSPEKKEAIVLSRFQGLKYKEIALVANCTENTIKSRVQRGLMELKEIIEKIEI